MAHQSLSPSAHELADVDVADPATPVVPRADAAAADAAAADAAAADAVTKARPRLAARVALVLESDLIAALGIVQGVILAAAYVVLRGGVDTQPSAVLRTLGVSLFVLALPATIEWLRARRSLAARRPFVPGPAGLWTLVALALVLAVGWVVPGVALPAGAGIAAVGHALGVAALIRWARAGARRPRGLVSAGLFGALLAVWLVGIVWGSGLLHPLFVEGFAAGQEPHRDSLFHVAIASVWRTYGVASTGVDGVPFVAYHSGSHWAFAGISRVVGIDELAFYQLGFPLIVVPLLTTGVVELARQVRLARAPHAPTLFEETRWLWLVYPALVGVLPLRWLSEIGASHVNPIVSESHAGGLLLSLLAASLVAAWVRLSGDPVPGDHAAGGAAPRAVRGVDALPVIVACLVPAAGFTKLPHMVLLLAGLAYAAARSGQWRRPVVLGSLALATLLSVVAYRLLDFPGQDGWGGALSPAQIASATFAVFSRFLIPVHLFWTAAAVALRLRQVGVRTYGDLWATVRSGRLIDVEVLLLVTAAGIGPTFLLDTLGNNIYFSDLQRWLAVSLLVATAPLAFGRARSGRAAAVARSPYAPIVALLALSPLAAMFANTALPLAQALGRTRTTAEAIRATRAGGAAEGAPEATGRRALIETLARLGREPEALRRRTVLYVPPHLVATISSPEITCLSAPFAVVALARMALLDAVPRPPCNLLAFGYGAYRGWHRSTTTEPLSDEAVCRRARRVGFRQVVRVDTVGAGIVVRQTRCGDAAHTTRDVTPRREAAAA